MATASVLARAVAGPAFTATPARRTQNARRAHVAVRAGPQQTAEKVQKDAAPDSTQVDKEVMDYVKQMPGISQPFPNVFDPCNFLTRNVLGQSSTKSQIAELRRWRESELTHGRVAMLASVGFLVQEQIIESTNRPFPYVKGPAIIHFQQVEAKGAIFWLPLFMLIASAESYRVIVGWATPSSNDFFTLRDDYKPGHLGFDPLGLYPKNPKDAYSMQTKELNNGRLAMLAIAGFVGQELKFKQPLFADGNILGLPQ